MSFTMIVFVVLEKEDCFRRKSGAEHGEPTVFGRKLTSLLESPWFPWRAPRKNRPRPRPRPRPRNPPRPRKPKKALIVFLVVETLQTRSKTLLTKWWTHWTWKRNHRTSDHWTTATAKDAWSSACGKKREWISQLLFNHYLQNCLRIHSPHAWVVVHDLNTITLEKPLDRNLQTSHHWTFEATWWATKWRSSEWWSAKGWTGNHLLWSIVVELWTKILVITAWAW